MQIDEVKRVMAKKISVLYGTHLWELSGCVLRVRENNWYYQAELLDTTANSVTIADLSKVEIKEDVDD